MSVLKIGLFVIPKGFLKKLLLTAIQKFDYIYDMLVSLSLFIKYNCHSYDKIEIYLLYLNIIQIDYI